MASRGRPLPPAGLDSMGIAQRYQELLRPLSLLPPPKGPPLPAEHSGVPSDLLALLRELVAGVAREPRFCAPEPGLSPAEQGELRRRLRCHWALVCEALPRHYLCLLRGGGSGALRLAPPAALTRLRAQLLQHCGQLLHPARVRAALLRDMRGLEGTESRLVERRGCHGESTSQERARREEPAEPRGAPGTARTTLSEENPAQNPRGAPGTSTTKIPIPEGNPTQYPGGALTGETPNRPQECHPFQSANFMNTGIPERGPTHQQPESPPLTDTAFTDSTAALTLEHFIKLSRPQTQRPRQQRAEGIRQIRNIQPLDLSKVYHLLPCPQERLDTFRNMPCQAVRNPCPGLGLEDATSAEQVKTAVVRDLKRCLSLPNLRLGELLANDLGIHMKGCLSQTSVIPHTGGTASDEHGEESAADDLRKLMQASNTQPSPEDQCDEVKLPPLISASNHRKVNAAKLMNMEKRLQNFSETEEAERCEDTLLSKEPTYPQTDTVDLRVSNNPALKTADVQVSNRMFVDVSEIQKYPPIYNDLLGEIEPATVNRLDRNLFIGEEIREVYTELMQSIPTEHLQFDQDPDIEPYAVNVDLSKCLTSSTLTRKSGERVINAELSSLAHNEQLNTNTGVIGSEQIMPPNQDNRHSPAHSSWLKCWTETVNFDDYLTYVASQDSDYLGVVFHLYNSDDSENEDDSTTNSTVKYQEQQQREKDKIMTQLLSMKQEYIPGMWNSNTIMLGGLGANPTLENLQNEMGEEGIQNLQIQTKITADDAAMQCRLEEIWNNLYLPEHERLDMAIKYSSNEYQPHMPAAIRAWEQATEVIQKRELLLAKLERFEQTASDPNRLFKRGYEGTLLTRTKESKERKALHFQISKTETELLKLLQKIKKTYNDTVTFKGRPYLEKMQWDKVEMLYWLQQERRKISMEMDMKKEHVCVTPPPLHPPL